MRLVSCWKSLSPWSLAVVAMAASQVFGGVVALLHVFRPDLDPVAHHVSEYVAGDFGWLMTVAFVAAAVGSAALAEGLRRSIESTFASRMTCLFLWVASAAQATMAVFPIDAYNAEGTAKLAITWVGDLHDCAANWNLAAIIGAAMLAPWAMRQDSRWRGSTLFAAEFGGAVAAAAGPIPGLAALAVLLLSTSGQVARDRVYGAAAMFAAIAVSWHFVVGMIPTNEGLLQRGWILASLIWGLALCEMVARKGAPASESALARQPLGPIEAAPVA